MNFTFRARRLEYKAQIMQHSSGSKTRGKWIVTSWPAREATRVQTACISKKSLKIHFIRGISRKTLYCLCKIKNKAASPFSFLIWVTSNWMLPVWFLRLSLSLYSKAKMPSKSELKSFFCFNFSFKKITFSHKRLHFASLLTCEWQAIKLIKSVRRGVPEERVKFSFKTTFIKGGLIGWVACFHNTDERMLTSLSQTWIWILEKFT